MVYGVVVLCVVCDVVCVSVCCCMREVLCFYTRSECVDCLFHPDCLFSAMSEAHQSSVACKCLKIDKIKNTSN